MLQKTHETDQEIYVMFDTDGSIKVSCCSKTTDQSQNGKYYAFKGFILDLIQKMTDPAG